MPRVLIIERDPMARALMAQYLSNSEPYPLASAVATCKEALPILEQTAVDLLLLDASEGFMHPDIKRQFPHLKVIVTLSQSAPLPPHFLKSLEADNIWVKEPSVAALLSVMDKTMAEEKESPTLPSVMLGAADCSSLTQRELEVLQELVNAKTDAAIAEALNMSVPTVKYHISNIREKTKLTSRTELAVCAVECGLTRRTL